MSILSNLVFDHVSHIYKTKGNVDITRVSQSLDGDYATKIILDELDHKKGLLFSSSYEYPGRYTRWDIGFINPPVEIRTKGRSFRISSLNERGEKLLEIIHLFLANDDEFENLFYIKNSEITGTVQKPEEFFAEEDRSKQSSIFTLIRKIIEIFASDEDSFLGLYGTFGYDLIFQFEQIDLKLTRDLDHSDIVLYIPDELIVIDHQVSEAYKFSYDFKFQEFTTENLKRNGEWIDYGRDQLSGPAYIPGKYAGLVEDALKSFKVGDLFEVVPTHIFYEQCSDSPTAIFSNLKQINPSPYGFIVNLGGEFLVGASPEMYVRVEGKRVETCPISGTIKRGKDAIEDARQIKELLNSEKDESELTMCTDVDRNDKSRICIPGSVKVIGRRQPEMYSHLIHTVDHVEGFLRPEYDSIDAFITHMWAVTITGAPKRAAIKWIESHEDEPRQWYGGAVGYFGFNGNINTGLILRTVNIKNSVARIQVGATLLSDSIPKDEEAETLTKAAALVQAIRHSKTELTKEEEQMPGLGKKILFVDHEDSFVHTLGNYFRQTGAEVTTLRTNLAQKYLTEKYFDLVVLSPGPGKPLNFNMNETIRLCLSLNVPIFGVCLGLQGLVEYFGGKLNVLNFPRHGKQVNISVSPESSLFQNITENGIQVGLYHSLFAEKVPDCFRVTSRTRDGIVMSIEHKDLPIWAVQFHPESIMTSQNNIGLNLIKNVLSDFRRVD